MNDTLNNNLSNIDQKEVDKFSDIASHWWNSQGALKALHNINPLRLKYIVQRSEGIFAKKVLDVGCGGGIFAESMVKEGAEVTGIDVSKESLQVALLHALENKLQLNYVQETVEEHMKNHSEQYDLITCMEMLEHVPNPSSVVHACSQLVKPGGNVFFSTINRNIKSWLMVKIIAEYILHCIPCGTHNTKKFIKPIELIKWFKSTSLIECHIIGLYYNPINDKCKLSDNVDLNYILHAKRHSH